MLEASWADVGVPRRILAVLALTFGAAKAQRAPRHFLKSLEKSMLSASWAHLGASWALLGSSWRRFGASRRHLQAS